MVSCLCKSSRDCSPAFWMADSKPRVACTTLTQAFSCIVHIILPCWVCVWPFIRLLACYWYVHPQCDCWQTCLASELFGIEYPPQEKGKLTWAELFLKIGVGSVWHLLFQALSSTFSMVRNARVKIANNTRSYIRFALKRRFWSMSARSQLLCVCISTHTSCCNDCSHVLTATPFQTDKDVQCYALSRLINPLWFWAFGDSGRDNIL